MKANEYSMASNRQEKVLSFKTGYGSIVSTVRELYLRPEVPCGVKMCDYCSKETPLGMKTAKNLLVVDGPILLHFWELFLINDFYGVVITQSSLHYVLQNAPSNRLYNKIRYHLMNCADDKFIYFMNEFSSDCHVNQKEDESLKDLTTKLNLATYKWFVNHFHKKTEICFISNNKSIANENAKPLRNVIENYYAESLAVKSLFENLEMMMNYQNEVEINDELQTKPGYSFPEHFSTVEIEAGLKSKQFLKGTIRVSPFRPHEEAVVCLSDMSSIKHTGESSGPTALTIGFRSEILVTGKKNRNRAIDGDTVVIKILHRSLWKRAGELEDDKNLIPCGIVVGILNRNWRTYVCSIESNEETKNNNWQLVTPWSKKIPKIRIHLPDPASHFNERFTVKIYQWDSRSDYPVGNIIDKLGKIGDLNTEIQTILHEYNLKMGPFSDLILAELNPLTSLEKWVPDQSEIQKRRDLRDLFIFSIDPPGCQDVDDALSIKRLPDRDGKPCVQLGVHIADVTYFIPTNSPLDMEARKRTTSVYMADRRFDMLPHVLSGNICSLWSGVERYAVSVIWELNPETCEVFSVWYGRTLIKSSYKLTYQFAQDLYDLSKEKLDNITEKVGGKEVVLSLVPELKKIPEDKLNEELIKLRTHIEMLSEMANNIKRKRLRHGGLELESIEVGFSFENPAERSGKLEDLIPKVDIQMHSTVAELMIYANHWVAKKCLESYPTNSCLRRHPAPVQEHFDQLKQLAASRNFIIDTSSNKALAESLDAAKDSRDPEINNILRQLTTRAMTNALYFSTGSQSIGSRDEFAHYGLALDLYTHFTSPIRRYADILVHRLLLASVGASEKEEADKLVSNHELNNICDQMNEMHWAAQQAQRISVELFQCMYFNQYLSDSSKRLADGIIFKIKDNNQLVVQVSKYGIRGNVHLQTKDGDIGLFNKSIANSNKCPLDEISQLYDYLPVDWQPSTYGLKLSRSQNGEVINVENSSQILNSYEIFDHLLVRIEVNESKAHGMNLKMVLLGKLIRKESETAPSALPLTDDQKNELKDSIFKNVRNLDEEKTRKRQLAEMHVDSEDNSSSDCEIMDTTSANDGGISTLHNFTSNYWKFKRYITSGLT